MARPRKEIDRTNFEKLCGLQCSLSEVAGFFDCSEDTVERWCKRELKESFAEAYKRYSVAGKLGLRRSQFKLAEKSAAMAIFLGKQYLGQKDVTEVKATATGQLADLIEGLREPYDIHTETADVDGIMED